MTNKCVLILLLIGLAWAHGWGHDIRYVLSGLGYGLLIFLVGRKVSLALLRSKSTGIILSVQSMLVGLVIVLCDYFAMVKLRAFPGMVVALAFAVCFIRRVKNQKITELTRYARKVFSAVLSYLNAPATGTFTFSVLIGVMYYAALTVYRINPETWQGDQAFYNVDMSWHIAMSSALTKDFPVRIPSFYGDFYYVYHCLPHLLSAHASRIFGLIPSLAYLQTLPVLMAIFVVHGMISLFRAWRLPWLFSILALGVMTIAEPRWLLVSRHLYAGESMSLSIGMLCYGLCLLGTTVLLTKYSMQRACLVGLSIGFCTVSKGSLGPTVAIAIALIGVYEILFQIIQRNTPASVVSVIGKYLVCGASIFVPYAIFFHGSIHAGGIRPVMASLQRLWVHPQVPLVAVGALVATGILVYIFVKLRELRMVLALLGISIIVSALFFRFAEVYGNQHYFIHNISLFFFLILTLLIGRYATRFTFSSFGSMSANVHLAAALVAFIYLFSNGRALQWLSQPYAQRDRPMKYEKDVSLDMSLYKVIKYVRDHTPAESLLIYRIGTDLNEVLNSNDGGAIYPNLQTITGFSERISYVGYLPEYIAHAWGYITATELGRKQLLEAREINKSIFEGTLNGTQVEALKTIGRPMYILSDTKTDGLVGKSTSLLPATKLLQIGTYALYEIIR